MGKIKCFEIIFSNNKSVYHPGDKVSGQCIVELKGDMRMRALKVFMRGIAKVHWTESRSTGTRLGSYTEHYSAEVEYFLERQVLWGGGKTGPIQAGFCLQNKPILFIVCLLSGKCQKRCGFIVIWADIYNIIT